jgi:hypothetical protein
VQQATAGAAERPAGQVEPERKILPYKAPGPVREDVRQGLGALLESEAARRRLRRQASAHPELRRELAPGETRDMVRSRRVHEVRPKTESMKRISKRTLEIGAYLNPPVEGAERPRSRAECVDGPRPCPWVSCRWHLYLDVQPGTGAIKLTFPHLEVEEIPATCALDIADAGPASLEVTGGLVNVTRERIRQIEVRAQGLLKKRLLPLYRDTGAEFDGDPHNPLERL